MELDPGLRLESESWAWAEQQVWDDGQREQCRVLPGHQLWTGVVTKVSSLSRCGHPSLQCTAENIFSFKCFKNIWINFTVIITCVFAANNGICRLSNITTFFDSHITTSLDIIHGWWSSAQVWHVSPCFYYTWSWWELVRVVRRTGRVKMSGELVECWGRGPAHVWTVCARAVLVVETTADHWSLVPAVTGATRVITTWLLILSSDTLITVLYHQRKQMVLKEYLCRILIDWSWISCDCINVWNIFDKYFWSPLSWAGWARCQNTGANWNKWSYSDRSKQPIQFYPGGIKPSQALNETGESCPGCWSKGGRFIQRARERREHGGSGARIIYIGW